jgi:PAS domain S-box-containing protein
MDAIKAGNDFSADLRIVTEKGTEKSIYIEGTPKFSSEIDGKDRAYHGIVQDITARKRAETELSEKEKQLRSAINNIEGVLLRYQVLPNGEDRVIYVSDGTEELYGVKRDELLQSTSKVWNLIHPDDLARTQKSVEKSAQSLSMWDQKFRMITPEGELKWLHGRGAPEQLENGAVQWDTLILDVTESIRKEQMNEALVQEVHHRVKNNLAIIIALIQMELIDVDEDQLNSLPLERTATRIYSLSQVHEMLYGQGDLGSVNSDDYFKKLVNMVKDTVRLESQIDVKVETNGICLNVNELSPLGMLVNELLTNSMKVAVDKRDAGNIEIRLEKEEDQYSLIYRDSGPGISKEQYENIETTGMKIIHILLDQLRADRELLGPPGFGLKITFKHIERGAHGVEFLSEL